MKRPIKQIIALSTVLTSMGALIPGLYAGSKESIVYVSPSGSDSADGLKKTTPVATLEKARDIVRSLKGEAGDRVIVELLPGEYKLEKSFQLGPEDSGRAGETIIYRSSEKGAARINGGKNLSVDSFSKVAEPGILERLDPAARESVLVMDLAKAGISHRGPFPDKFDDQGGIFELFDSTGRLPVSRWPNKGNTQMGSVLEVGDKNVPGVFVFGDDRPLRWLKNSNIWLKGQWRVGWEDPALRVGAIDPEARTIKFAVGLHNGIGSKYHRPNGSGKEPWCAVNLLEEIDTPGEWAIDFASEKLYLWPREENLSNLFITQLTEPLIQGKAIENVEFHGLTLEHSLGDGFVLEEVKKTAVRGCVVRDISGRGITIHGTESGVQSCDIHDVGRGAIAISGGDRRTISKSNNFVINNHLYKYGVLKHQYSAGVHVGAYDNPVMPGAVRDAVGIRIANNVLHHAPRDAFLYCGNDNLYEYNEVYYCGYDTADVGAFYSWLDWTMRGNVIRYNYMHNTIGGVNPDDGASGNIVYGNVFAGPRVGVWIASGPDNRTFNNLFVKKEGSVFGMDDRGVSRGYATNPRLIKRLQEINPQEEPWKSAHPELATMLDNRPELPWRTEFVNNLIVSQKPAPSEIKMKSETKALPGILKEEGNVTTPDESMLTKKGELRFAIPTDSEFYNKVPGFKPIPFEKIGLVIDEFRTSIPGDEEMMRTEKDNPYPKVEDKNFGT